MEEERKYKNEKQQQLDKLKGNIIPSTSIISKSLCDIIESKSALQLSVKSLNSLLIEFSEIEVALAARQTVLIRELRYVFPITQSQDNHKSLCILNVRLPNTDFTGCVIKCHRCR